MEKWIHIFMIKVNANLFIKQIFEFIPDGKDRTRVLVSVAPIIVIIGRGACQTFYDIEQSRETVCHLSRNPSRNSIKLRESSFSSFIRWTRASHRLTLCYTRAHQTDCIAIVIWLSAWCWKFPHFLI